MAHERDIDESWLIDRIREGMEFAFEHVFRCYYKRLCLFAQKYVSDSQTAESIVLLVFERLWEKREEITISQSLSSYLFRSVYNECLNHLNSFSHRQKPTEDIYQYLSDHRAHESSFLSQFYADELDEKIKQCIKGLPRKCREIFYLSRYKGLSHEEIARKLNLSVRTVENHIGNALKKLRKMLKER